MKRINRALASVLAVVMMAMAAPMAKAEEVGVAVEYPADYATYSGTESLDALVDMDSLEALLHNGLGNCQSSIDISSYGLKVSQISLLSDLIYNEMTEIFHIVNYSYTYNTQTTKISKIEPTYNCTLSVYRERLAMVESARDALLEGIIGNDDLSQVEKALLIHDRISMVCDYDYSFGEHRGGIYGVLVLGTAVCQGYAETYDYLLEAVGIDGYLCVSDALNHAWNIIKIGNEWYHVDVTWDDYAWESGMRGAIGAVGHSYFLLSSAEIYKSHKASDYDTLPDDTTYDQYFWQNSRAAFQLVGDEIYYIDNDEERLKRYSDKSILCDVSSQWRSTHGLWANSARLATDGKNLYYSLAKGVYEYNIIEGRSSLIFEPTLSSYNNIYGMVYVDGNLICDINDTPPYSKYDKSGLYQVKQAYASTGGDTTPPTVSISATNNLAASQLVALHFTDDNGIAGYYWGTNPDYIQNPYTSTKESTAERTVDAAGTYYLWAKDVVGNISEPCSISFYKTVLNGNGAEVSPAAVLTAGGKTFQFPDVAKEGYHYRGWSTNPSATGGQTSLTPSQNATYYAIFEKALVTDIEIISPPVKRTYYIGDSPDTTGLELKVTYSDNSTQKITTGFSIGGFDSASTGMKEISITYEGKSTAYSVNIVAPTLTLSVNNYLIHTDEHFSLSAETDPEGQEINWHSNNPDVAKVEDGVVTGIGAGTAEIIASFSYNGSTYSKVCIVTVENGVIFGDANGDKNIDTADAIMILRYLLGEDSLGEGEPDFNNDGAIQISDVVLILRHICGNI